MNFFAGLTKLAQAATGAVAQKQRQGSRRGAKKPGCTPCQATAYVESLRTPPPPRRKR